MMQTVLSIALNFVIAWGCAHHARRRGRNPTLWFIAGVLFGIFAFCVLFILPSRRQIVLEASGCPVAPKIPTLTVASPTYAEKFWYYLDEEKKQFGPMSFDALSRAWNEGLVQEQTYVWNEAMENWQRFKDVVQLQQTQPISGA